MKTSMETDEFRHFQWGGRCTSGKSHIKDMPFRRSVAE